MPAVIEAEELEELEKLAPSVDKPFNEETTAEQVTAEEKPTTETTETTEQAEAAPSEPKEEPVEEEKTPEATSEENEDAGPKEPPTENESEKVTEEGQEGENVSTEPAPEVEEVKTPIQETLEEEKTPGAVLLPDLQMEAERMLRKLSQNIAAGYIETDAESEQRLKAAKQAASLKIKYDRLDKLFEIWDNEGQGVIDLDEIENLLARYKHGQENTAIRNGK